MSEHCSLRIDESRLRSKSLSQGIEQFFLMIRYVASCTPVVHFQQTSQSLTASEAVR